MKYLLVGSTFEEDNSYPAVQLQNYKSVFDNADIVTIRKPESDKKNPIYYKKLMDEFSKHNLDDYDFVIGVGDFYWSGLNKAHGFRKPNTTAKFVEFNNHPEVLSDVPDYVLYHLERPSYSNKKCKYVGQGLDPSKLLMSNPSNELRILVDHRMANRNDRTDIILSYLEGVSRNIPIKVIHHSNSGLVENQFVEPSKSKALSTYKKYSYLEMCKLYSEVDVFFPTHRETQGLTGLEVAMCGGLPVISYDMYPQPIRTKLPNYAYGSLGDINWKTISSLCEEKHKIARREKIKKHFSLDKFKKRVLTALEISL